MFAVAFVDYGHLSSKYPVCIVEVLHVRRLLTFDPVRIISGELKTVIIFQVHYTGFIRLLKL